MKILSVYFVILIVFVLFYQGQTLFIDGCPMFGCRPSGSFSLYLQVPKGNVSINWASNVFDPIPTKFGCVANSYSLVCPNNGPFSEDRGYLSLFPSNGTTRWRDSRLKFPTLPLLDNYGDVTGSDGVKLVHYDADGTKYPVIACDDLQPMFSMSLVGNSYLLLVSGSGFVVVRETNGVPVGSLTLNATIQSINGSFIPIAQPVVNLQRFYVLTKFVPLEQVPRNTVLREHIRLYAIDVHASITNRIEIVWHEDIPGSNQFAALPMNQLLSNDVSFENSASLMNSVASNGTQALLWNRYNKTVYVLTGGESDKRLVTGIQEQGATSSVLFQSHIDALNMAMFVSDHCSNDNVNEIKPILWVSTGTNLIQQISLQGKVVRTIDLSDIFNTSVTITSKLTVIRSSDEDGDVLVFGITPSNNKLNRRSLDVQSYVVALDTAALKPTAMLLWRVALPDQMVAKGQIAGIMGQDSSGGDQLIVYADNGDRSARVFSISS